MIDKERSLLALLQNLISVIPDMVSIHDRDMNIVFSNWKGFGAVEEEKRVTGSKCYSVYRGYSEICPHCQARQVFDTGESYNDVRHLDDGRWVDIRILPMDGGKYVVEWVHDITERMETAAALRESEEKLWQSQKLDALGNLAGGVAHDFNNMLGGILGAADLLDSHVEKNGESGSYLEMIKDAAGHAAELAGQLLTFSRKTPLEPESEDLNRTVKNAVAILRNTLDRKVEILMDSTEETFWVKGNHSQLESVFLNLGINASHAMKNGGILSFHTKPVILTEADCRYSSFDLSPGAFVEIIVRDRGTGIAPDILDKIFEPFFTTKERGKGTGLGLSASYGTIVNHKGSFTVYSELGKGTSFTILLPLEKGRESSVADLPLPGMGSGTILLVDDEEVLRETGKAILETYGYRVILAGNGGEALDLYRANRTDLVLLDMIMPGMSGKECFYGLREMDGKATVILSSGFSQEEDVEKLWDDGLSGYIKKPFRGAELVRLISQVMSKDP